MKTVLLIGCLIFTSIIAFSQTTFTFNGNGNWSIASNWSGNVIPPAILPAGSTINIDPVSGGSCILNVAQTISPGANFNILPNANFIISGSLTGGPGYPSVTICDQVWMTKNLNVSKYRNGDIIPQVTSASAWASLTTGAWCWYNNDSISNATYGRLYNWYAINDPRGLAPAGWHIPTNSEWYKVIKCIDPTADTTILIGNVSTTAGGAMKDTGTVHWYSPNTGATNSTGFWGFGGGTRADYGTFYSINLGGYWWILNNNGRYFTLDFNNTDAGLHRGSTTDGFSVRCVKD